MAENHDRGRSAQLHTEYAVLHQGAKNDPVGITDALRVHITVYADGGERRLHAHVNEDHSFIVLEGEATFQLGTEDNGASAVDTRGVMLPRGSVYSSKNTGEGNLVMLRAGAPFGDLRKAHYPDELETHDATEPSFGSKGL